MQFFVEIRSSGAPVGLFGAWADQGLSVASLQEHVKSKPEVINRVGLIKIDDRTSVINQSTWLYVKSALDHFKGTKPDFIILGLVSAGGRGVCGSADF